LKATSGSRAATSTAPPAGCSAAGPKSGAARPISACGPPRLHPTAGAVLVAARPPLAAFNVYVDAPVEDAKRIAAQIRGPHVKALGLELTRVGKVQVSTNIEDLTATTPGDVVRAVQQHATVTGAELVAPAPRAAFESFPADVPLTGAPLLD